MITWWLNGEERGRLDPLDRGLHYGDGLFETLRVTARGLRNLERHLARLRAGCARLGIGPPDADQLRAELVHAAAVSGGGVVKLVVTRGPGGRGYRAPAGLAASRIIYAYAAPEHAPEWAAHGVEVRYCRTRLALQPALAGLKHLNRLEQVLARSEWDAPVPQEGLMLDTEGRVVCGTMSNLFVVRDGAWLTPRLDRCGVAGTMRAALLERCAAAGVACAEVDLSVQELRGADELFLTNALIGAWPVRSLEGSTLSPGPAVRQAQHWIGDWT